MRAMMVMVGVLVVVAAGLVPAGAQAPPSAPRPPEPPPPLVVTTGRATVRLPPDRAFLVITTETRAPRPADAQKRNATAMAAVVQKLEAAQLPKDAIRTLSYTLNEEFDYPNNKRTSRGFRAANAIELRIDEIARVGEVLDLAIAAGATNVSDIRFDLKDRAAAERQALRLAVLDARARADSAAGGAGATVGAVLRIDDQGQSPPPRPMPMMAMRAAVADASQPETTIAPGEIEIESTVTLTATLK